MTRFYISADIYQDDYQTIYVHDLDGRWQGETEREIELYQERHRYSAFAPKVACMELTEPEYRKLQRLEEEPQAYGVEAWIIISNKLTSVL